MFDKHLWFLLPLLLLLLPAIRCQLTDQKKSDEDRPYKFGFNIEGYQHRKEEKDTKGLIKGEYGFITADGYYRVTVYATDENGDFKILSMKNYYVGFPPEDPTTTPQPPTNNKPAVPKPTTKPAEERTYQPLSGRMGCSNCIIPSTTTNKPGQGFRGQGISGNEPGSLQGSQGLLNPGHHRSGGGSPTSGKASSGGSVGPVGPNGGFQQGHNFPGGAGKPIPGQMRDGLPPGVTVDDIKGLLYRFNYTVGFHGHQESGYRNGDKEGNYFFDGRDGTERRVEYVANEFGYQPNITLIELSENDVRRPNELTEKQYGLKGYEFKWFYRR